MRISAKAEYACIAMLELAAHQHDTVPVRIKTIAEAQSIPPRFLVQILLQLKTAGLVQSVRGASGGYQLNRSPESITLAEVINAIDARNLTPLFVLRNLPPTAAVETLRTVGTAVLAVEQSQLEELSLADLVRRGESVNALSYQI